MNLHERRIVIASLLTLAFATVAAHAGATIGANFTGQTSVGLGITPPDTDGAIGPTSYTEFVNGAFNVYDRTGTSQLSISDNTFWTSKAGVTPAASGISDPRIVYDSASGRWFASEIDLGTATSTTNANNNILVAVSKTSDPTGAWSGFKFAAFTASGTSNFADYPTLGINGNAVTLATNDFNAAGTSVTGVNIISIPKADLLAAAPTVANRTNFNLRSANTYGFTVQPTNNFDGSGTSTTLIAASNTNYNQLVLTNVSNTTTSAATLGTPVTIATTVDPSPGPVDGTQPGTTIKLSVNDDSIHSSPIRIGNFAYTVQNGGLNGRSAVGVTKIDLTTNTVVAQSLIGDPNFDYLFPSIAANANGDIVIGVTRTGAAADARGPGFASAFALVGKSTGGTLAFDAPLLLKAGTATYLGQTGETSPVRWGDYSQTFIDPNNPLSFWTVQEYAIASSTYGTQITQIVIPEPATLAVAALSATMLLARRRRRSA